MNHCGTIELITERLLLRRVRADDLRQMYDNWCSRERVARYLTWSAYTDIEPLRERLDMWIVKYDDPATYRWGIELLDTKKLIGMIDVVDIKESVMEADIGYCLCDDYWGAGIMTEAFSAVIEFLFDAVGFNRIAASHVAENPASGRVMQKCGLRYEGLSRSACRAGDGRLYDLARYAILRSDRK